MSESSSESRYGTRPIDRSSGFTDRPRAFNRREDHLVGYLLRQTHQYRILSREREQELFAEYERTADPEIRETLVLHNIRLVVSIAKYYQGRGLDFPDIVQEGICGLMKAIDEFERERNIKFSVLATDWIRAYIIRAIQNLGDTIRIPVHVQTVLSKISMYRNQVYAHRGVLPTEEEIAAYMELPLEKVKALEAAARETRRIVSFEENTRAACGDDAACGPLCGTFADPNSTTFSVLLEVESELKATRREMCELRGSIHGFKPRHVELFLCYKGLLESPYAPMNYSEVAARFACARLTVVKAVRHISNKLGPEVDRMIALRHRYMTLLELAEKST